MSLENKTLDEISEADLQDLIANQTPEKKTIDYKRDAIGGGNDDKKEFLADVSSFANASGGHLIIGMVEDEGIATELCGISVGNRDAEVSRLENIIRDGIRPRLPGIGVRAVDVASKGTVALVIRVPKSWASPHMVSFAGGSRFFSRKSNGKYQLDVDEIRSAFVLSETVADRIREFRIDRIGKILSDDTPVAVTEGAKAVLHLVPLNSFATRTRLDLEKLTKDYFANISVSFNPILFTDYRRNIDGIVTHAAPPQSQAATRYIQFFGNGCVEYVEWLNPTDEKTIPSPRFEFVQIAMLSKFWNIYHALVVAPPIFIMFCMLNVRGYKITTQNQWFPMEGYPVDREHLIVPEECVESFDVEASTVLKPIFDTVWNAAGFAGSQNYDENGNRISNRRD